MSASDRARALPKYAFEAVQQLVNDDNTTSKVRGRYATLARRLPALLQSAGLGQSVAFLLSRMDSDGRPASRKLLEHLGGWLLRDPIPYKNLVTGKQLMRAILDAQPSTYRHMSREAAYLADWLKRFATGLIAEVE